MRTFDATILNNAANHPEVRPWLGGEGPVNLTASLLDPNTYAFVNQWGGFIGHRAFDTVYECHTMFVPQKPGIKPIIELMKYAEQFMFTNTDCERLITKVSMKHSGQHWLAKHGGFVEQSQREGISYQLLPLDRWAQACSTTRDEGERFHGQLEQAKRANGSTLPVHPEDPAHDAMVGAALLMAKAGNAVKGVNTYNRWAVVAGYVPILLLKEQPPVVDIHDAVLGLGSTNEVEILLCR